MGLTAEINRAGCVDAPLDSSLLQAGIEQLGHAMAVLDTGADRLMWCSTSWRERMPGLCAEASWSHVLATAPDVAHVFDSALCESSATGQVREEGNGSLARLDVKRLEGNRFVLQLLDEAPAAQDMRQYMQAREHLFSTSRTISVSEMATTLAHEIRQPIATITNILRGVKRRLSRGDTAGVDIEEALDKALGQAQFTNSVISRIRDFTDARRPKQQLVDVGSLLQESLVLMDWLFSNNQCRVSLVLPDEPLHCQGDRTMLQQVLVNLLRNGVESMQEGEPSGRLISVTARVHGEAIRLGIHDRGHGLDGKENTLFVPFATSKSDGMGVGLNICRSFVELHQGRLWLAPNADGGCTSYVELPMSSTSHTTNTDDMEGGHDG